MHLPPCRCNACASTVLFNSLDCALPSLRPLLRPSPHCRSANYPLRIAITGDIGQTDNSTLTRDSLIRHKPQVYIQVCEQSSSRQESALASVHCGPLPCMCMHPTATPGLLSFIYLALTILAPPTHTRTSGC